MQKNVLKKLFISHKFDLLLGAVLLIAALCLFFVFRAFFATEGGEVTVRRGNKVIATYSLTKDATYELSDLYGSNTLVIKDGKAFMQEASCHDKICMHMGSISKVGEMIICLPNQLFIVVTSGEEGDCDAVLQ